jgi:hypothetical protein
MTNSPYAVSIEDIRAMEYDGIDHMSFCLNEWLSQVGSDDPDHMAAIDAFNARCEELTRAIFSR